MSAQTESLRLPAARLRASRSFQRWTERESVFSWLMIIPPMAFLLALVGYPFIYGIWLSLENRPVAQAGTFIGLANFVADFHDPVFWQVVQNTFVYTGAATVLKMIGGLRGDEVDVEAGWVAVNGKRLANSATLTRDSAGRPLTHVVWGKRRVGTEEVWLFGLNNRRSWDSRYFGPIPFRAIRGVAEPLVTW